MDKAIQLVMVAAVAVLVAAALASIFIGQSEGFTGFLDEQRESAADMMPSMGDEEDDSSEDEGIDCSDPANAGLPVCN